jgi:(2Fe-2S) ferredoxin
MKENLTDKDRVCALAPVTVAPIKRQVFVCNGKSCTEAGSPAVKDAFRRELGERGLLFAKPSKGGSLKGSIVLTDCGSVGFCAVGAAVLVYPDGVWYAQVEPEDVREIVESHLIGDQTVERLALLKIPATGESPEK